MLKRLTKQLSRLMHKNSLYLPMKLYEDSSALSLPQPEWKTPTSPIDKKPAEQFLFTTPDTRFGDTELNYIYLDTRYHITITYPPIPAAKLDSLYRKNYSTCTTEIKLPATKNSPFRGYFGGKRIEKIFFRLPIEMLGKICRINRRNVADEIQRVLHDSAVNIKKPLRFFDVGCFEGDLLDQLAKKQPWQLFGLEPNLEAATLVKNKGYRVWHGHAENALEIVDKDLKFDVIHMGQSIEHVDDPVYVLERLRLLLSPGGVLILSTPNLDSKQIQWFGPTWAHWHAPYHRYIFSKKGLTAAANQAGLSVKKFRSYSHFYWTAMSICQNKLGLMGSVSHNVIFDKTILRKAARIVTWSWLLWDWRGRGDYFYMVLDQR